jgi:hypothetical protein
MTLVKSLHGGDPDVLCLGASAASSTKKAKSVQLFGLHRSAVHVCSCMFMYVHVAREPCGGLMWMFRIVINKLFE